MIRWKALLGWIRSNQIPPPILLTSLGVNPNFSGVSKTLLKDSQVEKINAVQSSACLAAKAVRRVANPAFQFVARSSMRVYAVGIGPGQQNVNINGRVGRVKHSLPGGGLRNGATSRRRRFRAPAVYRSSIKAKSVPSASSISSKRVLKFDTEWSLLSALWQASKISLKLTSYHSRQPKLLYFLSVRRGVLAFRRPKSV